MANITRTPFKKPSKKHTPKGLVFLYEDKDILVVNKTSGLLTTGNEKERDKTAIAYLNEYVKKGNSRSKNKVLLVNRLDREVSGILIFAKTGLALKYLQDEWTNFKKSYFALVYGKLEEKQGEISSHLAENKARITYTVKNVEKGELALTKYKVLAESKRFSLVEITPETEIKNQMQIHFSELEHPILGDLFYGRKDKSVRRFCLHAATLKITHPFTKEEMTFETNPPAYFGTLVDYTTKTTGK